MAQIKQRKTKQNQYQYQIDLSVIEKCNELYKDLPQKLQIPALQSGYDTYKKCLDIVGSYQIDQANNIKNAFNQINPITQINNVNQPKQEESKTMPFTLDKDQQSVINDFLQQKTNIIFDQTNNVANSLFQQLQEQIKLTQYKISDTISLQRESQQKMDQILLQSTKKGQFAENQIEIILQDNLPNFVIDKTTKISNSGDFQIYKDDNKKILLEIKNYTQTVPYSEVEKFIRDVNSDHKIKYGCFVSIGQKISKTPNIHVNKLSNNKIVCYLGNFGLDNFQILIHILLFLEQTQVLDQEQIDIEHQIKIFNDKTTEYLTILKKNKKDLEKQIEQLNNQINIIEQLQSCLQRSS